MKILEMNAVSKCELQNTCKHLGLGSRLSPVLFIDLDPPCYLVLVPVEDVFTNVNNDEKEASFVGWEK